MKYLKISITYRNLVTSILVALLVTGPLPNTFAWDALQENGEFAGVRTNYNPSFGPFAEFFPADSSQRTQDLLDYGFFGLYVLCDTGESIVRIQYSMWNEKERDWFALPLAPIKRVNVKFGSEKAISWNVSKSEWWNDGSNTAYLSLIFSNPSLFMKKLNSANTISLPINADRKDYQVKFITKNFSKHASKFKRSGCN